MEQEVTDGVLAVVQPEIKRVGTELGARVEAANENALAAQILVQELKWQMREELSKVETSTLREEAAQNLVEELKQQMKEELRKVETSNLREEDMAELKRQLKDEFRHVETSTFREEARAPTPPAIHEMSAELGAAQESMDARLQAVEALFEEIQQQHRDLQVHQDQTRCQLGTVNDTVRKSMNDRAEWIEVVMKKMSLKVDALHDRLEDDRQRFNEDISIIFPRARAQAATSSELGVNEARLFALDKRIISVEEMVTQFIAEARVQEAHAQQRTRTPHRDLPQQEQDSTPVMRKGGGLRRPNFGCAVRITPPGTAGSGQGLSLGFPEQDCSRPNSRSRAATPNSPRPASSSPWPDSRRLDDMVTSSENPGVAVSDEVASVVTVLPALPTSVTPKSNVCEPRPSVESIPFSDDSMPSSPSVTREGFRVPRSPIRSTGPPSSRAGAAADPRGRKHHVLPKASPGDNG